ncbi:hypothetical protein OF83DRAFT_1134774 [Amylostereum chailletii]|nr:hypothetical protein OF83DRAFT_1134774 [Amylostereum chailletii]
MITDAFTPLAPADFCQRVKGMYRILDLVNEKGSGGLVDKIVIDQDSVKEFINALHPGAYSSLTKINFKILDQYVIKPIGVYGSKEEIVRFLSSTGAIDDEVASKLLAPPVNSLEPPLRSGLYVVRTETLGVEEKIYVVYWPEETTWNDSAMSSVQRTRATFIRYLTKITDQNLAFVSSEHAAALVWKTDHPEELLDLSGPSDADILEPERIYTFEVAEIDEQEESVRVRAGINISSSYINGSNVLPEYTRLLRGDTVQGILTAQLQQAMSMKERLHSPVNPLQLSRYIETDRLTLLESLDNDAIDILLAHGLRMQFPQECDAYISEKQAIEQTFQIRLQEEVQRLDENLAGQTSQPDIRIRAFLVNEIVAMYPALSSRFQENGVPSDDSMMSIGHILQTHPEVQVELTQYIHQLKQRLGNRSYISYKRHFILVQHLLRKNKKWGSQQRVDLGGTILKRDLQEVSSLLGALSKRSYREMFTTVLGFSSSSGSDPQNLEDEAKRLSSHVLDNDFLNSLNHVEEELSQAAMAILSFVHDEFSGVLASRLPAFSSVVQNAQKKEYSLQLQRRLQSDQDRALDTLRRKFIRGINSTANFDSRRQVHIQSVTQRQPIGSHKKTMQTSLFDVQGVQVELKEPEIMNTVHILELPSDHIENIRRDPKSIPIPSINPRHSHSFPTRRNETIRYAQLLDHERLLVVIQDTMRIRIYLEPLGAMHFAISQRHCKEILIEKVGHGCVFAYDEIRRLLAICSVSEMELHMYAYDEMFENPRSLGTAIPLHAWMVRDVPPCHMCFIPGTEDVLLVDSSGLARIFSMTTQQFRPASLRLHGAPTAIFATPDGSCFLALHTDGAQAILTAYHWSTFGSNEGHSIDMPGFALEHAIATSFVNRSNVHIIALQPNNHSCVSIALDVSQKITGFNFVQKDSTSRDDYITAHPKTAHNCLMDCHTDVWTRYPVVPAVGRRTITSSSLRCQKCLAFVTDRDQEAFRPYFSRMIQTFEQTTRKPVGDELRSVNVQGTDLQSVLDREVLGWQSVTSFKAGEWLVDLFCLIPIHIAICRDNRFMPLKNGVSSADLERSLLGAEVNQIVDKLSFGWYESVFQSYLAAKPVKVVSSMGEQSVGKSFTLNHLVDTSFAGSAMRTTEGVWMSVTPTDDEVIVSLDFEGVHSIERSAQEDMLLVLFNTALSNLVLFRNNFALSRDIKGLFQSFQSSSSVLDPATNPSLFQSRLVIIIKDVVDADHKEVKEEFSQKFSTIVRAEQSQNFITRLHRGQLNIIPWPVIESREFYTLFPALKRLLDRQTTVYKTAGEFSLTMKTLMAKLKANDWGAMSQTLASHRAKLLAALLPVALQTGFTEVSPVKEILKDLDSDTAIDVPDTGSIFFVSEDPGSVLNARETALQALREGWERHNERQLVPDGDWIADLGSYLDSLADSRIQRVRTWIVSNTSRFEPGQASIDDLLRTFDLDSLELKANIQLCKTLCPQDCHLFCVLSRLHEGPHDCQTSHHCIHDCAYCMKESQTRKICGLPAGHAGKHICEVNAHLCGDPCELVGKPGCMGQCTKAVRHEGDEHMCSAPLHTCGEPCALHDVTLQKSSFSCKNTCRVSCHEPHDVHECNERLCPIQCQLCKRLCSQPHLHGLEHDAVHLCGQTHNCTEFCGAPGICEIDTTPHSIQAMFTGRHDTFQYTKYTQVAKRLPCAEVIPSGRTAHTGDHLHNKAFHYCEAKCESCGYFCTLELGHRQQEHETSHGSMSETKWVVQGSRNTFVKVGDHKFSANDEGSPMMCSQVCASQGRHIHFAFCRSEDAASCRQAKVQHVGTRMLPEPDRAKDKITHDLYWRRTGFKDPYSHQQREDFAKCDAMCPGPEHNDAAQGPPQPSYCRLPMFHEPVANGIVNNDGYISHQGHHFFCKNPATMQQSFHVIFVIDRSSSMGARDRLPLPNTPTVVLNRIKSESNNRLGAAYSALYGFWVARNATTHTGELRRDAYSVLFFDEGVTRGSVNDFTSTPDELLEGLLHYKASWGTDFNAALRAARSVMEEFWSPERKPVVIFLSDGECGLGEGVMEGLCRSAGRLGTPLSFHSVSFGRPDGRSAGTLRRMAEVALLIQNRTPHNPRALGAATVPSSYAEALDTVSLAETFLGIAEALRKPHGSLLSSSSSPLYSRHTQPLALTTAGPLTADGGD